MRSIGHIDHEQAAKAFGDYLESVGIENQIEEEDAGRWNIWVLDDDDVEKAEEHFAQLRANPRDPKFRSAGGKARAIRQEREKKSKGSRWINVSQTFHNRGVSKAGKVTITLAILSILVAIRSSLGTDVEAIASLFMTDIAVEGDLYKWYPGLLEIRAGEIWRLFTPMFIHFGPIHLFFNLYMTWYLAGMVEYQLGPMRLLFLVVLIQPLCSIMQYVVSSPVHGGLSGVVYGLVGYVWIRGKYQPESGLHIPKDTLVILLVWFAFGFTGILPIANTAHAVGLISGIVMGFLNAKAARRQKP